MNSPDYVGSNVRITLHNGISRTGRILSAEDDVIELQYTVGKKTIGTMTFELTYDEIKSIEIDS